MSERKPRKRNPRRVALEMLQGVHTITRDMVFRWRHVPSLTYYRDPGAERATMHYPPRKRSEVDSSEYIENLPQYWGELYNQMVELEQQARAIRKYAREQYVATGGKLSHG